jgi:lysophospholipid acyltransferase (LPLAT)-like uncharacterized protein
MKLPANWARRLRFFALEKVALPVGIVPLRALVRTWRARGGDDPSVLTMMAAPRVILATYHGMFLHLLAYSRIPPKFGRRLVVLVSPSLDGRLLAAALAHFGIDHVFGTSSARAVSGAREFIGRIAAGGLGVIAADGPRGPCCVAKPGLLEIAALADAQVFLALTSARRGLTLPSWDRTHLPAPFTTVDLKVRPFVPAGAAGLDQLAAMQSQLIALAHSIASPVLPASQRDDRLVDGERR